MKPSEKKDKNKSNHQPGCCGSAVMPKPTQATDKKVQNPPPKKK